MRKDNLEPPLKDIPKLFFKKNAEEFFKKDKEDKLTKEDLDDWIDLFSSFVDFFKWKNQRKNLNMFFDYEKTR
jgi:hypothetical protein